MKKSLIALASALVIGFSPIAGHVFGAAENAGQPASVSPVPGQDQGALPNVSRGQLIATQGRQCGSGPQFNCSACFTCHEEKGQGSPNADIPRLNGQSFIYLYRTLKAFASGERESAVMTEVAQGLSDDAMRDVAAYYAEVTPPTDIAATEAEDLATPAYDTLVRGSVLVNLGDMSRGIQGCVNCHGPNGIGLPPSYPYLAGQYAGYLQNTLTAWKTGKRGKDPLGIMAGIASRLTDEEIKDVSQYLASIHPVVHPAQGTLSLPAITDTQGTSQPEAAQ